MRKLGFFAGVLLALPLSLVIGVAFVVLAIVAVPIRLIPECPFTVGVLGGAEWLGATVLGTAEAMTDGLSEIGREEEDEEKD